MTVTIEDIKSMKNKDLLKTIKSLDEQIYKIQCYGLNDLRYLVALELEADKRGIELR